MPARRIRMAVIASTVGAVASLGACRAVLGIDDLPDAPATDASADAVDAADAAVRELPDPAWAQWHVPDDIGPRVVASAGVAQDPVTGLVWQRAPGPAGSWSVAAAFCESSDLEPDPEGVTRWRLPTRIELLSIVDFERPLDGHPFPDQLFDPRATCYWTISGETDRTSHWVFDPNGGLVGISTTDAARCVPRCIRGVPYDYQRNIPPEYVIENGVVRDPLTRLEWQADSADSAGKLVSLETARARCTDLRLLDHRDWRLPTVKELATLVDERQAMPALDPRVAGAHDVYWSSTLHEPTAGADAGADLAWRVSFTDGSTIPADDRATFTAGIALVRCVRDY